MAIGWQGGPQPQPQPQSGGGANPYANLFPSMMQLLGFGPRPYQDFGGVPTVNPTMIDPSSFGSYLSPMMASEQAALAPTFARQDQRLNEDVASRGIYNSSAASDLQQRMMNDQYSTLLGASIPGAESAVSQNASAANAASGANAAAYGNVVSGNEASYNNFLNELLGMGSGVSQGLMGSILGSYAPNSQALGTLGQGAASGGAAYQGAYGSGGFPGIGSAFSNMGKPFGNKGSGSGTGQPLIAQSFVQ